MLPFRRSGCGTSPACDIELAQHSVDGGFETEAMNDMVELGIERDEVPSETQWQEWVELEPLWRAQAALGLDRRPTPHSLSRRDPR